MPKDPRKNIQNYKIDGGHLNEYEFKQAQGEIAEESEYPFGGANEELNAGDFPSQSRSENSKASAGNRSPRNTEAKATNKSTQKPTKKSAKKASKTASKRQPAKGAKKNAKKGSGKKASAKKPTRTAKKQ